MFYVTINNNKFQCPSSWNELNRNQLLRIAGLSRLHLTPIEFKTVLLPSLLGLETIKVEEKIIAGETCFVFKHNKKTVYIISAIDIAFIIKKLDWLFVIKKDSDGNEQYILNSKLSKQIIPEISFTLPASFDKLRMTVQEKIVKLYGPESGLSNIILQEYIHTETFFNKYQQTGDIAYIDKLIAVLYRKQSKDYNPENNAGDRREEFNDYLIEKHSKLIKHVDADIKYAIILFYIGCNYHIQHLFPEVFKASAKTESSKSNNTFMNMMKLVTALTGNDVTKNEQVRKTSLYEIFISLQEMRIQNDAINEQIEKYKK